MDFSLQLAHRSHHQDGLHLVNAAHSTAAASPGGGSQGQSKGHLGGAGQPHIDQGRSEDRGHRGVVYTHFTYSFPQRAWFHQQVA